MRICLYSLSPKVGGGVVIKTMLLLRYLIENGHHVVWVYPKVKGILPSYVKAFMEGYQLTIIEKTTIPYFRVLDSIDFFSEVKGEFDIYQVVSGYCVDGMAFQRLPGKYFIWSATTLRAEKYAVQSLKLTNLRQVVSLLNYKLGLLLEKISAKRAYKIFAASNPSRLSIIDEFKLRSELVETVHPIIDIEHYGYKSLSSRSDQEPYVLYMGIFSGRKNIDLLVRSFVLVHDKNQQVKLKLVGKLNGLGDYFQKLIDSLGLNSCIEIVGEVADNVTWYQNAICTVLTSYEEGFGMVLAESLSCGTPVISTVSGGVVDIVKNNVNGFLVDYSENDVAEALIKMCEDRMLRESFSINGRSHIEKCFSINAIGPKILAEYSEFICRDKK